MTEGAWVNDDLADEGAFAAASRGAVDAEILQLEARLRTAQLTANLRELNTLISDDLLFAGPDGQLATKEQDIESHRSGLVRFLRHEPRELRVRRLTESVAVATLAAQLTVSVGGAEMSGAYRYTRVWQREPDGVWRVVAGQVGAMAS